MATESIVVKIDTLMYHLSQGYYVKEKLKDGKFLVERVAYCCEGEYCSASSGIFLTSPFS
jgi:hypothetical protein|tara:strand:+ start:1742 stop:1921 length:180 start_codon:yes stop_codon:yes gene_type:complete